MEPRDYLKLIKKATTLSTDLNHDNECIICYKNGEIVEMHLHTSFIKNFYYRGERRDICPYQKRQILIEKLYPQRVSDYMQAGNFFEQNVLGRNAKDEGIITMPRHAKTGKMLTDEIRIRQQIDLFPVLCKEYGITIKPELVQITKIGHVNIPDHPEIMVFIHGTADFLSPVKMKGYEKDMCVIDLKLTKDINSTFGEFGWGNMQYVDKFQGILYSMLFELPFAYWIFDYKKDPQNKFEPINTNTNHPNPEMAEEAKLRIQETKQTIYNMVDDLVLWEAEGWPFNPTKDNCEKCNNIYCENKDKVNES